MKLIIEAGTYADIDELEHLYDNLNDVLEAGTNYRGWKKGVYPVRENALKGIADGNLYVARDNNKIVGSVILSHEPENAYHNVNWKINVDYNDVFVIHTFVVHPLHSRLGVGEALMNFASVLGTRLHMKSIRLDVYENNMPAINLYEKCGYEYVGTVDLGLSNYGLDWFRLYERLL